MSSGSGNSDSVTLEGKVYTPADIVKGLISSDLASQKVATRACYFILEEHGSFTALVEAGIIPPLVKALGRNDCSDLQFEAARCLTSICIYHCVVAVVDGGAIPALILLLTREPYLAAQAAWALGWIAQGGAVTRDAVLEQGGLWTMLPYMKPDTPRELLKQTVLAYSSMCYRKNGDEPRVNLALVSPALPAIAELLLSDDHWVQTWACWALRNLTAGGPEATELVQSMPGLMEHLAALLGSSEQLAALPGRSVMRDVTSAALEAIANMLDGTDSQRERCLAAGCLEPISAVLDREATSSYYSLTREIAVTAIANLLKGSSQQIQRALELNILEKLRSVLDKNIAGIWKQVVQAITNFTRRGTMAQLSALQASGCLEPYCALLKSPDPAVVLCVLDGIHNMMQTAAREGGGKDFCVKLQNMGLIELMDGLQHHENDEIYKKNLHIIDTYFDCEE